MIRLSASSLARAEICPGSAVLPQVPTLRASAERGKAMHAALEQAEPEGAEVAFVYNALTGKAREVGRRIGRDYPKLADGEIPGTADRLTVEPDRVRVRDYKSGVGFHVAPPASNLQLGFLAVAAADAHGRSAATVELEFLDQDGRVTSADLDSFDLASLRARIRSVYEAAMAADTAERPPVVTGDHCTMCPCAPHCPAYEMALRAFGSGNANSILPNVGLSPVLLGECWPIYELARRALGEFHRAAEVVVSAVGEVPTADGRVLTIREVSRETLDGDVTFQVVRDLHGEPTARQATTLSATKASLERALATVAPKGSKAQAVRHALEAIRAANGVNVSRSQRLEAVKPAGALLPHEEAA